MKKAFFFSMRPAISRIAAKLRIIKNDMKASEIVELSPEVMRFSPGMICLDEEFSRAISAVPTSSLVEMAKFIPSGDHKHGATIAYCLKNAFIADGSTYCGAYYSNDSKMKRRILLAGSCNHYEEIQLSSTIGSELYFGHWLLDGTCQEIIAEDRNMLSLIHDRPARFHEPEYREILGLSPIQEKVAFAKKLWVIDDRGINNYKLSRFSRVLDNVTKFRDLPSSNPEYIFLARRGGVDRNLTNELALVELLEKRGFEFVDCTEMNPQDIIKKFSSARIVISVEGSHQSHAVLSMPSGGALISIQPPEHVNLLSYRDFCDFKDIRQSFLIGDLHDNGFSADPQRLLRLLDLTLSKIDRNIPFS